MPLASDVPIRGLLWPQGTRLQSPLSRNGTDAILASVPCFWF